MANIKTTLAIITFLLLCSCSNENQINSKEIEEKNERIEILSEQIIVQSDILDAEYSLFKTGGFSDFQMPALGPTDIHYQFVIKVNPQDVDKWITELKKVDNSPLTEHWKQDLTGARMANWHYTSTPEYYTTKQYAGPDYIKVVYRKEGIIFSNIYLN